MNRIVLGTVQLGMRYGVNNTHGQPTRDEAFAILDTALAQGIKTFDTAYAYGTAEDVLGDWLSSRGVTDKVKIISKMRPHALNDYPDGTPARTIVETELKKSLARLKISSLDGYLLHSPHYIYLDHVIEGLEAVRKAGFVKNVGVSIYDEQEALQATKRAVQYVQVPYNAFDQRLNATSYFADADKAGITTFARSPFLQGALLMEPEKLPDRLAYLRPHLAQFRSIAERYHMTPLALSLRFALEKEDRPVVFGVDTVTQLNEDLACANESPLEPECIREIEHAFANLNHGAINPSLWSKITPK